MMKRKIECTVQHRPTKVVRDIFFHLNFWYLSVLYNARSIWKKWKYWQAIIIIIRRKLSWMKLYIWSRPRLGVLKLTACTHIMYECTRSPHTHNYTSEQYYQRTAVFFQTCVAFLFLSNTAFPTPIVSWLPTYWILDEVCTTWKHEFIVYIERISKYNIKHGEYEKTWIFFIVKHLIFLVRWCVWMCIWFVYIVQTYF